MVRRIPLVVAFVSLLFGLISISGAFGLGPIETTSPTADRAFVHPDLHWDDRIERLDRVPELADSPAWRSFLESVPGPATVFIDLRSATPATLKAPIPIVPGRGIGNRLALADVERELGRPVRAVDAGVVSDLVTGFVRRNAAVFGVDARQIGTVRASSTAADSWQVSIGQAVDGIAVRESSIAATIRQGNLVLFGTSDWANVVIETAPRWTAAEALERGFAFAGGRIEGDEIWQEPRLEIAPTAPESGSEGEFRLGAGLRHRLVWSFGFRRVAEPHSWEVLVDATTGEVISLDDTNLYFESVVQGGVYPRTSTEICPNAEHCGAMTPLPMPFADVALEAPERYSDAAGGFAPDGTRPFTRLFGDYFGVLSTCGPHEEFGDETGIDLGGDNGEHRCEVPPGHTPGDTPSARTSYYHLNRASEAARGWLPGNDLDGHHLRAFTSAGERYGEPISCNAQYDRYSETFSFFGGNQSCRETGEIAAAVVHEWGHALDDLDANGRFSKSPESYADIAAALRTRSSCIGYGFASSATLVSTCGRVADDTGPNLSDSGLCMRNCSGLREVDFAEKVPAGGGPSLPSTPALVCNRCDKVRFGVRGPCGLDGYCDSTPITEAVWDLATRDLTASPYGLDAESGFLLADRLFFLGAGNVKRWYSCGCRNQIAHGCSATSGYMQFLAADDDDGSLGNGTPHLGAIRRAFGRHAIACAEPSLVDFGCGSGPKTAPTLAAFSGDGEVVLVWSKVANAPSYPIFRSEGPGACSLGKAKVGETTANGFTHREVAPGVETCYVVAPQGGFDACVGPASGCACATPERKPFSISCGSNFFTVARGATSSPATCTVTSNDGFSGTVSFTCFGSTPGLSCGAAPVVLSANGTASTLLHVSATPSAPGGSARLALLGFAAGESTPVLLQVVVTQ